MSAVSHAVLIYELQVMAIGSLIKEFTDEGIWVFFHEDAPPELLDYALLHSANPPTALIAAGQILEIEGQQYRITAVGEIANINIRNLGHLVLKANGAIEPELPGEVCIEALPLPQPSVSTILRVWTEAS